MVSLALSTLQMTCNTSPLRHDQQCASELEIFRPLLRAPLHDAVAGHIPLGDECVKAVNLRLQIDHGIPATAALQSREAVLQLLPAQQPP
mmetsp:Transcript_69051/g.130169  ORF Transcript_69051/g.130169 Transcript_69051/m.130169 type:complete len:90 (-) Transcript_69051:890-1159(-)